MPPSIPQIPGKGPSEYLHSINADVMVPSFLAPIFTSIEVAQVGPEALKTSARLITILTGRLAFRASANATGSIQT